MRRALRMEGGTVRRSTVFLLTILLLACTNAVFMIHGWWARETDTAALSEMAGLVKTLQLTDLALFTEARYTRHLSQADLHSPFQDHPVSLEHFPSGSLVLPPQEAAKSHGKTMD